MSPLEAIKEVEACAEGIKERIARVRAAVVGREAVLTAPGKYFGRRGKIDGVFADERDGIMLVFMVYRMGTKEFLNSDGDSRTCRRIEELMVLA